ncbi:DUF2059 domain-containing protein [Rhodospira trueperi]|uniref:DUF2059 domain-containing protein n=1 Tax=Rhodospira trueperi TaxID=69960 RepID=A0A1G6XL32_9PROT|nr:DUF2059 domain-containing protein [Rhodospira trueperi]SDD78939.1 hypothetical protein SAMN05421720_101545 [Rhodospira trueperi]
MTRVVMICLAVLAMVWAPCALALEDTAANRWAQAVRYERAVPTDDVLETSVVRVARMLPPEHRQPFIDYAVLRIDRDGLRDSVLTALTETFSADELRAMADFFGSPVGQSVARKMGRYTERVMPLVMTVVRATATGYAREQEAE